jgi:hypothetical protein
MAKMLLVCACFLFLVSNAVAQTKASGTMECGKADSTYEIQIPEQEGSVYSITKSKCIWTKSFTIAGLESIQNAGVDFNEAAGTSSQTTSSGVTYYKNGDKTFHRGTGTNDPRTMIFTGKWMFVGGTGKFRGIKGGGTSTCKMKTADVGGEYVCEVKGEYTLPGAGK